MQAKDLPQDVREEIDDDDDAEILLFMRDSEIEEEWVYISKNTLPNRNDNYEYFITTRREGHNSTIGITGKQLQLMRATLSLKNED